MIREFGVLLVLGNFIWDKLSENANALSAKNTSKETNFLDYIQQFWMAMEWKQLMYKQEMEKIQLMKMSKRNNQSR